MISPGIEQELRREMERLPPEQQQRVLEYARGLSKSTPRGVPGHTLLRFAGAIEPDDLALMAKAIEEGCEKVNSDDW